MEKFTLKEIVEGTGGELITGYPEDEMGNIKGFAVDSRLVEKDFCFFALPGERTDGHRFLQAAASKGASVLVISDQTAEIPGGPAVIKTENTLTALQSLAQKHLERMDCKKIAVTGSVGKTTTRDFVAAGIATEYKTVKNLKNYNSDIGMPLSILSWDQDAEAAVLEMGMDGPGQIRELARIFKPDIAVITNIGTSHMELMGSRENIFKAKMEVTEYFGPKNTLIVNGRDDMLSKVKGKYNIIKVGTEVFKITDEEDHGINGIQFSLDGKKTELPFPGMHNAINTALAVAVGSLLGIEEENVIKGIKETTITGNRMKVYETGGVTVIDDSYNAAPASMKSAIRALKNSEGKRKIAFLGDMNELGKNSEEEHFQVGLETAELDIVVAVGDKGKKIAEGAKAAGVKTVLTAADSSGADISFLEEKDTVLLKASRSMELEKIGEKIIKSRG